MDENGEQDKSPALDMKEKPVGECKDDEDVPSLNAPVSNDLNQEKSLRKRKNLPPSLIVSNFPKHFTYPQIKKFLEELCDPCEIRTLKDVEDKRVVQANFKSLDEMQFARKALHSKCIDDVYINVMTPSLTTKSALHVQTETSEILFIVDSGATHNFIQGKYEKIMTNVTHLKQPLEITITNGDNDKLIVRKKGQLHTYYENTPLTVEGLVVKKNVFNLLSVNKLQKGKTVTFKDDKLIIRSKKGIYYGGKYGNLYTLKLKLQTKDLHMMNLPMSDEVLNTCMRNKSTRLQLKPTTRAQSNEVGKLTHSDVVGPMKLRAKERRRHYQRTIDEYSHFIQNYLFVQRNVDTVIKYVREKRGIKRSRSDNKDTEDNEEVQEEGPLAKRKRDEAKNGGIPWGLDMDVWREDPKGLYGVKPQYLASMGISEPLFSGVLVSNFRGGRNKLLELFELAGEVLSCTILHKKPSSRYACILYSHPLEALQAVTMFDGQIYCGNCLSVKMRPFNKDELPEGLEDVGRGFSNNGNPLRDVVRHYKRYIKGQSNELNLNIFRTPLEQSNGAKVPVVDNDSKTKAKASIESLIAEGVDIKDLVQALKEVIAAQRDEATDPLIDEFMGIEEERFASSLSKIRKRTEKHNTSKSVHEDSIDQSDNSSKSVRWGKSPSVSPDFIVDDDSLSKDSSIVAKESELVSIRMQTSSLPATSTLQGQMIPSKRPGSMSDSIYRPGPERPSPWHNIASYQGQSAGPSQPMGGRGMGPAPFTSSSLRFPFAMPSQNNQIRLGPMFNQISGSRPGQMSGAVQGPPGQGAIQNFNGSMSNLSGRMSNFAGPMSNVGGQMFNFPGPTSNQYGPMSNQYGAMSNMRGPMSGPGAMNMPMGGNFAMRGPSTHPPSGPYPTGSEATLVFNNLPLSVTFALLSDRLSLAGPVEAIQFKEPGRVEVKYSHRIHALNSMRIFDKSRLDGNEIHVDFL